MGPRIWIAACTAVDAYGKRIVTINKSSFEVAERSLFEAIDVRSIRILGIPLSSVPHERRYGAQKTFISNFSPQNEERLLT